MGLPPHACLTGSRSCCGRTKEQDAGPHTAQCFDKIGEHDEEQSVECWRGLERAAITRRGGSADGGVSGMNVWIAARAWVGRAREYGTCCATCCATGSTERRHRGYIMPHSFETNHAIKRK